MGGLGFCGGRDELPAIVAPGVRQATQRTDFSIDRKKVALPAKLRGSGKPHTDCWTVSASAPRGRWAALSQNLVGLQ